MASPGGGSDDGAAAVCCMCGDQGLPRELFRCNLCRLRLQHRYCSELYPKVPGPYRSCNWCLVSREDGGGGGGGSPVKASAGAGSAGRRRRLLSGSRDDDDGRDRQEDDMPCGGGGCTSRSAFSADPGKPVKKPRQKEKGRDRVVRRPVVTAAAAKKRREVWAGSAGGKTQFRVKVRRYKLLAEVTC